MKKTFPGTAAFLAGAVVLITSCGRSFTQYVNPLIGSGGHGHVFVGAGVPFGMVQAGPVQYNTGWDWCSGYHYSDSTIIGFAQMHLSGTGIGDLGDISLMPVAGDVETNRKGLVSRFSHDNETVRPGYYSVLLDGSGIRAEMTSTSRVAFHRYT
ncbi:MAG: glycoside hydrolase family 92 protein, partial [Bacteroidales bacterium]|nr:glycoside hydrolase family 92 protein [Bacteroidales bacterium]